ncbi:MAG: cellulase family glycosylhydrolase [bacterium]|nr:cellulase family glycosylhydrolase [bacterium]
MSNYQYKGVNIGNWLVLEKWMSPDLFSGVDAEDEYHFTRMLPKDQYLERITRHRKEYITEHDFAAMATLGYNAVRIPIPFFIFGDRPPYAGCIEQLDDAFDWAEKYGLKILIDLHTVPGSQNGFDNGGLCGVCRWAETPEEVDFVLNLLEKLAKRYGKRPGLLGIQPLNEPISGEGTWEQAGIMNRYPSLEPDLVKGSAPIRPAFLRQFYIDAYRRIRPHLEEDKYFVFHDAFRIWDWKDFMQEEEFHHVALDAHLYLSIAEQMGAEKTMEGYAAACQELFAKQIEETSQYFEVICGEWCLDSSYTKGLTDPEEKAACYKKLAVMQQAAWEKGFGSFFWSYKLTNPNSDVACWDVAKCHGHRWIENK